MASPPFAMTRTPKPLTCCCAPTGTRDICCGGPGTKLYREVSHALDGQPREIRDRARLWRSSHEGGHRFAPTALTFPEGVSWAHLDLEAVLAIFGRGAGVGEFARHVKGAVSIERPEVQMADREGFVRYGWAWLAAPRTVSEVATDDLTGFTTVEVAATLAGEVEVRVRTTVELAGHIPKPPCGVVDPTDVPEEPVWRVVRTEENLRQ